MPSAIDDCPLDAIIIGAGFGGCYLLRNLRKQGFRVRLFDEGVRLGGVWAHNTYPGARVDTDVPFYEFSDPELWQEWSWSERFPGQPEIVRYFDFVDKKWQLSKDIVFGTKVTEASFDSVTRTWTVKTDKGATVSARYFLPAMGFSSKPYTPDIKDLHTFEGFTCHSARWPQTPVDLTGKRVGVIGSGATGVQLVQELGPFAGSLHAFQRSPNCALPMRQQIMSDSEDKTTYAEKFRNMRLTKSGFDYTALAKTSKEVTPKERDALWEKLWARGGFAPSLGNYPDVGSDIESNTIFYRFWRDKTRARILKNDPELIENLAPENPPFPFGTKRPSLERTYYEVFNQDNVTLHSLKKNPIDRVTKNGVIMADGKEIELDAILLATGFDAITGGFSRIDIRGLKNKSLKAEWATKTRTHLGLATSGFPNMFFMYGPQSPTAFAIGPVLTEIQGEWIVNMMVLMRENGYSSIEPTIKAEQGWSHTIGKAIDATLMHLNETTWYMGANIPGKKREALNYVAGTDTYGNQLNECMRNGLQGFTSY